MYGLPGNRLESSPMRTPAWDDHFPVPKCIICTDRRKEWQNPLSTVLLFFSHCSSIIINYPNGAFPYPYPSRGIPIPSQERKSQPVSHPEGNGCGKWLLTTLKMQGWWYLSYLHLIHQPGPLTTQMDPGGWQWATTNSNKLLAQL